MIRGTQLFSRPKFVLYAAKRPGVVLVRMSAGSGGLVTFGVAWVDLQHEGEKPSRSPDLSWSKSLLRCEVKTCGPSFPEWAMKWERNPVL